MVKRKFILNGKGVKSKRYKDKAPNTTDDFEELDNKDSHDRLKSHRIIPSFMIQGGAPKGNESGSTGYSIQGDFASNRISSSSKRQIGVISRPKTNSPNSANSQFSMLVSNSPHLASKYNSSGKVRSNYTIELPKTPRYSNEIPNGTIKIKK